MSGAEGPSRPPGELGQSPDRLVNLTGHEVVITDLDAVGTDGGSPRPQALRLPPEGPFAHVDDERASLGQERLNASHGDVQVTRLRRSAQLCDLPAPQP